MQNENPELPTQEHPELTDTTVDESNIISYGIASADFIPKEGEGEGEITLRQGDIVGLLETYENGWAKGFLFRNILNFFF